ncbi:MAG: NADH-quinone oxidoreductase subunit C, partial [Deltaproteobacteria bacterium]|nr:NADH-quinone oxidoreductase subunit C [Deltaproteobacteria bacterium]
MAQKVIDAVKARFPEAVVSDHAFRGDETLVLRRDNLVEVARFLRDDPELDFAMPIDVTAVDYLGWKEPRFEVVYHLLSVTKRHRIRLKVEVDEADLRVPTLIDVWPGVDWFEREAWDMYGVVFDGHPKLQRILLYEEFEGHPLRKDYPQRGYQPLMPLPTLASEV